MHLTHKTGGGPGLEEMTDQHGRPEQAITEEQMANVSEEWGGEGLSYRDLMPRPLTLSIFFIKCLTRASNSLSLCRSTHLKPGTPVISEGLWTL